MLLETRGVGLGRLHIQRRVHTQVVAFSSVLRSTANRADELLKVREFVARDVASQACAREAVLQTALTPERRTVLMIDPATGADRAVDVDWLSALKLQPIKTRLRPCGYWLSADAGDAVERLRLLGLQVFRDRDRCRMWSPTAFAKSPAPRAAGRTCAASSSANRPLRECASGSGARAADRQRQAATTCR